MFLAFFGIFYKSKRRHFFPKGRNEPFGLMRETYVAFLSLSIYILSPMIKYSEFILIILISKLRMVNSGFRENFSRSSMAVNRCSYPVTPLTMIGSDAPPLCLTQVS